MERWVLSTTMPFLVAAFGTLGNWPWFHPAASLDNELRLSWQKIAPQKIAARIRATPSTVPATTLLPSRPNGCRDGTN